ncbi:MAG TPA: tyrosine-type recombinase/integrase [Chthoniobacterales bacterium]|nr:tyrosine-type recombinase/integrase [Chthoniobacterales bacterium]
MACLVKLQNGRSPFWYCCYTTRSGQRLKKSTKQTDRAKAWEVCVAMATAEGSIAAGSATEAQLRKVIDNALERIGERKFNEPTVRQRLGAWIQDKEGAVAAATIVAYRHARELLLEFLGSRADLPVRGLKKQDAAAFRDHLRAEGRTPGTVNTFLKKYLTGPFENARKEGLIDYNPFVAVNALKSKAVAKDVFSPEQVVQLLNVARGTDWEGAILAGYTTGMRLQDASNLRWESVDLRNGLLSFVERKGNKQVVVGLHPDFENWIRARPLQNDPEAYVFPSLANRTGAGRNGLSKAFGRIMEKAGVAGRVLRIRGAKGSTVKSLSFHSFRHGAASAVFKNAALKDIARRVTAHSSRGVVDRYLHQDVEAIREATKLIPRLPKSGKEE